MDLTLIIIAVAFTVVLVGLVFALSGPDAQKASKRRLGAIRERLSSSNEAALAAQMRRTIAARLPGQEMSITKLIPNPEKMGLRLRQTGKKWTLSNYMVVNIAIVILIAGTLVVQGAPVLLALLGGLMVGFGVPHFVISKMIKARLQKFNARFPDAIDLLVRGLRSGLPIAETLNAVSTEIPGPVGVEFKQVIERVRIGKSMEAALQDSAEVIDTPEFQFFCITLAIQRETGGNLAETLGNLSDVLRKRAQMKLKIKAMSSEAKASAWIVGALPFVVFILVYTMNPEYVSAFFPGSEEHDMRATIAGLGGLCWMGIGIFIMSRMIDFEI